MDKIERIIRLSADSLSKARELSRIALDERPELRAAASAIMKATNATHKDLTKLGEVHEHNGKLDQATMDAALERILAAAQVINDEVTELLKKARS